ncbi:MAG: hypothetical protein IJA34_11100 [Lachnospiraceae bacterium]|nr:hypothetical protein [Lachnospiraceae bacterium]
MSEFTELLGEIIKEGNLTVYGLAKECDIDRTVLQKAITEGKKINYDTFIKIYEELKNVIGGNRIKLLYEKFSEEYYGLEEMNTIRFIRNRLLEMRKNEEVIDECKRNGDILNDFKISANQCIDNDYNDIQKKIINEVYKIIEDELNRAHNKKTKARIWMRFPTDWKFLRKLILYSVTLSRNPEKIDFIYCLPGPKRSENKDLKLLENYFTACEFAQYGFNTCSGLDEKSDAYFELVPYYIITGNKIFAIYKDGSYSINENMQEVNKMASSFSKIISDEEFFMKEVQMDLFSMISVPETCKQKNIIENICNDIDIATYYDKEIFKEALPSDIDSREGLIYILNLYNESLREGYRRINFTMDSVLKFVKGEDKDRWIHNSKVTKEKKLEILENIMNDIDTSKVELSMLISDKIKYHSKLNIRLISERMISCEGRLYVGEEMKETVSFLISPVINKHLRNYNQYISNSECCLNHNQSKRVFEMLIKGLSNIN